MQSLTPPGYVPKSPQLPVLPPTSTPDVLAKKLIVQPLKKSMTFFGRNKGVTVGEYANLLVNNVGIPKEWQKESLKYILPYLDPDIKPAPVYDEIIVQAGQPCIRNAVVGTFDNLAKSLNNMDDDDDERKNILVESVMLSLPVTFLLPLRYTAIGENVVYDTFDNAIATRYEDIQRMYPCDSFLKEKYPEAHKQQETRYIDTLYKRYKDANIDSLTIAKELSDKRTFISNNLIKAETSLSTYNSIRENTPEKKRAREEFIGSIGHAAQTLIQFKALVRLASENSIDVASANEFVNRVELAIKENTNSKLIKGGYRKTNRGTKKRHHHKHARASRRYRKPTRR